MPDPARQSAVARWVDHLVHDVRDAARSLRRHASASLIALLILGTALGANAALFAFLSGYFLKPLPIARAADHVELLARDAAGEPRSSWDLTDINRLRAAGRAVVEQVYGVAEQRAVIVAPGREPVAAYGALVSDEYFALLDAKPALGIVSWLRAEDRDVSAVVLSDAGWRRLAGARADIVGQSIRIDGAFVTVAGVMGPETTGLEPITPDFWMRAGTYERIAAQPNRQSPVRYRAGALLRTHVGPAAAADALTAAVPDLQPADAAQPRLVTAMVLSRPTLLRERAELAPLAALLLAAFALMTLVACANLSGMYLARAAGRTRDVALRFALGASRLRVARPLLIESLAIAAFGALLGWGLAAVTVRALHGYVFSLVSASGLTMPAVAVDWRVVLYSSILALLIGAVCALAPAVSAVALQPDAHSALGGGLLRGGRRPHRLLRTLVAAQAAVSIALLIAAGIIVRNAARAQEVDTGFALATLVDLGHGRPTPGLLDLLRREPRVESVATALRTPMAGPATRTSASINGTRQSVAFAIVDDRYFDTMGIAIERGRGFAAGDAAETVRRVVVSDAAAHMLWAGADPLGQAIDVDDPTVASGEMARFEVIGVAADALSGFFFEGRALPLVYLTAPPASPRTGNVLVRVRGDAASALPALRAFCTRVDPASMCSPTTLQALLDRQQVPFDIAAHVASSVGLLTLVLACLGLYGLVSFTVAQRTRDIGVRMAVGASRGRVLIETLRAAGRPIGLGVAIGLPMSAGLLALLKSQVAVFETFDAAVFTLAPLALAAAAAVAAVLPARRAAAIDPVVALRHD